MKAGGARERSFPRRPADADGRERLLERYLPLVRYVAERMHRRLPPNVDRESLVHAGVVGLLEALERYDPERGVPFEDYARYRIQGEIIQCLRSLDWVSRSVRAWGRKVQAVQSELAGKLGREPAAEEMAAALEVPLEAYYRVARDVEKATLVSLEEVGLAGEEKLQRAREELAGRGLGDPLELLEDKRWLEKLASGIEALPERERLVITLYYYEELTLKEIGEILGLSEGRICQIHAQAVERLRRALGVEAAGKREARKARAEG